MGLFLHCGCPIRKFHPVVITNILFGTRQADHESLLGFLLGFPKSTVNLLLSLIQVTDVVRW